MGRIVVVTSLLAHGFVSGVGPSVETLPNFMPQVSCPRGDQHGIKSERLTEFSKNAMLLWVIIIGSNWVVLLVQCLYVKAFRRI